MHQTSSNYRIIRWEPTADGRDGTMLVIGDYPDHASAIRARDCDVIDQLAENNGWYRIVTHLVLWRDGYGKTGAWTIVTAAGVDPARPESPTLADMIDTRNWLDAIHRPCA
jgi:hypothetical protein